MGHWSVPSGSSDPSPALEGPSPLAARPVGGDTEDAGEASPADRWRAMRTDLPTGTNDVLLVEDYPPDAALISASLRSAGVDVVAVPTLAAAVAARPDGFRCILLDLNLPDSAGLETLRAMLRAGDDAAVVVVTGLDDVELGEQAIAEGAEDFVVKGSLGGERLAAVVRYAVRRRRGRLAAARRGHVLELIARGAPVNETLAEVAVIVESYATTPHVRCVVLLLDPAGNVLHVVAATAPGALASALGAVPSSRSAACCATAPCRVGAGGPCPLSVAAASPVVGAAADAGYAACWSVPLTGRGGQPVGALLVLSDTPAALPTDEAEHVRSAAAHAALAVDCPPHVRPPGTGASR